MKKLLLIMSITVFSISAFAQNTNNLLNNYINIKNALVKSDSKTAATAIVTFNDAIKNEKEFSQKSSLVKAIEKLQKAGNDLEKQRAAFNDVSTIMWKLTKGSDNVKGDVFYQYCPMKKAYWLSKEKDIKNPYYGSAMLTCGKVAETK